MNFHLSSSSEPESSDELHRIQQECATMIQTLKALHDEEMQLRASNKFLAHRAAVMGCSAGLDGGTRREARRRAAAKKAAVTTTIGSGGAVSGSGSNSTTSKQGEEEQVDISMVDEDTSMVEI
jgi:hypothetical protein